MMKKILCVTALFAATTSYAATGVNVDVSTPNVRVQVGNQPPPVTVIERETVVVKDHDHGDHHDNGKHKGQKKHKKHKKEKKHDN